MTNKVIRKKSRFASCMVDKSRFVKQTSNKESNSNKTNPKIFIY